MRIRDYIVSQIKALRSPNINAQLIQQQGFLRFKDLYTFLSNHQPQLGTELSQAYVNTMRWYYLSQFTRYESALKLLKLHIVDKADLIGSADDSSTRRVSRGPSTSFDAFSIGRRTDTLRNPMSLALTSFVAEEDKSVHHMETIYRSFTTALVDNASFEYAFLTGFFSPIQSYHAITRIFDGIFAPTFKLGHDLTKSLLESSTDALGILLCVRLNQQYAFTFQRRKVAPGESYINGSNMLLWPRFQIVMDMHCDSIRKLNLTAHSPAPLPIAQRFASLLQGLLLLSQDAGDDEPVSKSLARLRTEFEAIITRAGKSLSDSRKRERFLYNNYSLIGAILEEGSGRLAEENRGHFDRLREAYKGREAR